MKIDISIKEVEDEQYLCIKLADLTQLKRKRKVFTPPTIAEVKEYCKERNNGIDAALFIAYYKTRGWYLSKGVKMKDWKSAITTWEKNSHNQESIQKGSNLADPPPKDFGVSSETSISYEQYKKQQ